MNDSTTGVTLVDTAVIWSLAAAALVTAVGLLWRGTRGARRIGRAVEDFIEDWRGSPERPGVPARAGVMERLDGIENRIGAIEHELHPNSGASLRDAVDRLDVRTRQAIPASGE